MIELPFAATAPRPGVADALADASRSLDLSLGEFIDSSEAKAIDCDVRKQFGKRFGRKPDDPTFESDLVEKPRRSST